MKFTLSVFLFFCLCASVLAQKADSLEGLIRKTHIDSSKTLLLSQLAVELTKSNPIRAVEKARTGISLAKHSGFEKGLFKNLFSLASIFQGQAMFDSAILYYRKANLVAVHRGDLASQAEVYSGFGHSFMRKFEMDSARRYLEKGLTLAKGIHNYRIEAGIYNNYGNVFLEESNPQKALDYFILAARLYEKPVTDPYGQCLTLSNIGNVEYRLGNYEKALEYARQSMAIAKRKSFPSLIGYAHKLLGRIYRKQENFDRAFEEYNEAQKIYLKSGDVRSAAEVLLNIGNIYYDKKQYQNALANYQQSLTLSKKISVKPLIAFAHNSLGQAYMRLGKSDEAISYTDSSRIEAQAMGNKYLVMDSYELMSTAYETKGDYKKALTMQHLFVKLKDSVTRSENRELAEEAHAKYELEKKEARIALLEKDKVLKNLALERHRIIQLGIAIALILAIIIGLLLMNSYRVSNKVKRLAEIDRVRNTLARDLHDDIGSTLSTINIISKLAMRENPHGESIHLNRIAQQSSQMMETMIDMVWSINPVNDSMEKVLVRMKVFAGEILEPKNISYRFSGEETLHGLKLDAEKRKNLYLIFKEAINNIAKYSEATLVEIMISVTERKLTMTIADNGKGFDELNVRSGNGLRNMDERARSMGAYFKLTSIVTQGTRVALELHIT